MIAEVIDDVAPVDRTAATITPHIRYAGEFPNISTKRDGRYNTGRSSTRIIELSLGAWESFGRFDSIDRIVCIRGRGTMTLFPNSLS